MYKIEVIVDKVIPLLLLILLFIIIGEVAFPHFIEKYHKSVMVIDWIIVVVFILDLIFKYLRMRNFPKFLRASWLEIIAIFPFFLVFRFLEGFAIFEAGETISKSQKFLHIGAEVGKEVGGALEEGARITQEVSRSERAVRILQPIGRFFKFGSKDVQEETKKQAEEVVDEIKKDARYIEAETEKETKIAEKDLKSFLNEIIKIPRHIKAALFYEKPKIMQQVNEKINKRNLDLH